MNQNEYGNACGTLPSQKRKTLLLIALLSLAVLFGVLLVFTFLTVPKKNEEIYDPSYEDVDLDALREEHPEYFSLNAEDGLTVYIWQLAARSYSCALYEGKLEQEERPEIFGQKVATTIPEMKAILSTYNVEKDKISLVYGSVLYSSYIGCSDRGHIANLSILFELDSPYKLVREEYDTVDADFDGDGRMETCTLLRTSSPVSAVAFTAKEHNLFGKKTEYFNYLCEAYYELSFAFDETGVCYVKAVSPDDPERVHRFDFEIVDGNVFLYENGTPIHDALGWDRGFGAQTGE